MLRQHRIDPGAGRAAFRQDLDDAREHVERIAATRRSGAAATRAGGRRHGIRRWSPPARRAPRSWRPRARPAAGTSARARASSCSRRPANRCRAFVRGVQARSTAKRLRSSSVHHSQRAGLGGAQHDVRCVAGFQRLLPARRAQAPAVRRLQPVETEFRMRGGQVVAGALAEGEEIVGHHRADRVAADVLGRGVAAAVAEEAGQRADGATLQHAAEHVAGWAAASGGLRFRRTAWGVSVVV